jgi:hypothetical protein
MNSGVHPQDLVDDLNDHTENWRPYDLKCICIAPKPTSGHDIDAGVMVEGLPVGRVDGVKRILLQSGQD